jgi:hypothetical protein
MARKSRPEEQPRFVPPPYVPNVVRPGDKVTPGPVYRFKQLARDDGKPYKSPEPKAERQLLSLLGTNAVTVVMGGLLVVVIVGLVVLFALKL